MSDSGLRKLLGAVATPRLWFGIALSLLALYLSVKDIQWAEVLKVLRAADRLVLLMALGAVLLNTWMKAVRWRLLFYPSHHRLSVLNCLLTLLVGQLANKLLPARLGDLARVYFIGEKARIGRALALGTTVIEKAMDSVMLLALIALLSLRMPMPLWLARSSLLLSGLLALLLVAVIVLASQGHKTVKALQSRFDSRAVQAWLRGLTRLVETIQHLGALSEPAVQAQVWGWSLLIWVTAAGTNVLAFWTLGLGANVLPSLVLLVVLMAGAALPTSPLQIGVFHYLCVLTLSLFGVEHSMALSYALVLHFVVHLPIVVGGALGLSLGHLDLTDLDTSLKVQGR